MNRKIKIYKILLVLSLLTFASGFLVPLWSEYCHQLGGTIKSAGNAVAILSAATAITSVCLGYIQDKLKCHKVWVVIAFFGYTVCSCGYFIIYNVYQLYLLQLLLGIFLGMRIPPLMSLYLELIKEGNRPKWWGYYNGMYSLALGLSAIAGSFIAHHLGFDVLFIAIVSIALISTILSLFL